MAFPKKPSKGAKTPVKRTAPPRAGGMAPPDAGPPGPLPPVGGARPGITPAPVPSPRAMKAALLAKLMAGGGGGPVGGGAPPMGGIGGP